MRDLKVTLVQADQKWEDKQGNFDLFTSLVRDITDTDLIVLPEMFNTAFSMNTSLAETMDGKSIHWLSQLAREKNAAVYTSLMISENGTFFNRGVFVYPSGEISTYDKRKTFSLAGENEHFSSGQSSTIVHYLGWNIQLHICYDLRFPEISRNELVDGKPAYDLILYVANWPEKRALHWKALLKARAIENQAYLIGVNRIGTDGKEFLYSGDSAFIDALGNEQVLPTIESAHTFTVQTEKLQNIRKMLPFLQDM